MPLLSSSKAQRLSVEIYDELRVLLVSGEFKPGERLKLPELAAQTGTSVTPVREALLRLVSENALEMPSARAFAVPKLSLDRFRQIKAIRLVLEGLASEIATPNITSVDVDSLEVLHHSFVDAEKDRQVMKTMESNREFHFKIYRHSNMPMLLASIESYWAMMGPILHTFYSEMGGIYTGAPQHQVAIKALREKDALASGRAIRADIAGGCEAIELYIRNQNS